MKRLYLPGKPGTEICFNVDLTGPLDSVQEKMLRWLLAGPNQLESLSETSILSGGPILEVGPRVQIETPASSNIVDICARIGIPVCRIEQSERLLVSASVADIKAFTQGKFDPLTEDVYQVPLTTFDPGIIPDRVCVIPVLEEGVDALRTANQKLGLGWDNWDIEFVFNLVINTLRRNPTDVELFQLAQMNSEHCRHWFFKGEMEHDGVVLPESLLRIVQDPLKWRNAHCGGSNSLIAFSDNSSAIAGYRIHLFVPYMPAESSGFSIIMRGRHIVWTAETHNHPTLICPLEGAKTGIGGCIRDLQATGRGGIATWAMSGYCVGNLLIPGYKIPGEEQFTYSRRFASPLRILVEGSNGVARYGNEFGIPAIIGFTRTFGQMIDGKRREYVKPVLFCGVGGTVDEDHTKKEKPEKGMLVVAIGGPAYPIGLGGGAASSMGGGDNTQSLDLASVQRGNAAMERKMDEVLQACILMGHNNPILSIHDQGAGGPCNVVTEIVSPAGAKINIRSINVGDKTMGVLKIWCAEAQERNAVLVTEEGFQILKAICVREGLPCEMLGKVTGDGKIELVDSQDDTMPVDLPLGPILEHVPTKRFKDETVPVKLTSFKLPETKSFSDLLQGVMRLPVVGSKGWLVHKKDRSVGGLVARQQCCGPLQLPVSNLAVTALGPNTFCGSVSAVGEQPIKIMVNPEAGARMTIAEMLTNIMWAEIDGGLPALKSSVNWMWPAKRPGEAISMYRSASALRDFMIVVQGAECDGGKDSLSMVVKTEKEEVKSPGTLVVSGYGPISDIRKVITPDIKKPGQSHIGFIDLSKGMSRLGGSALAQSFGQIGDDCPDADPILVRSAFAAVQELIRQKLILAGHDRSDGGLITTLCEMAMSGNSGMKLRFPSHSDYVSFLFAEELGLVIEYTPESADKIRSVLLEHGIADVFSEIGVTANDTDIWLEFGDDGFIWKQDIRRIRHWWEATSDRLEMEQMNPNIAENMAIDADRHEVPRWKLTFVPKASEVIGNVGPAVAVIRAEGSNGHREMWAACAHAGFSPWDVTMSDLMSGQQTLKGFRGLCFVGGFSHADVLGSAKGWAALAKFNPNLEKMFKAFYERKDTFSFGVCNGCQFMTLLGLVPGPSFGPDQVFMDHNLSGKFESRFSTVKIGESNSIMLKGMEKSVLGIIVSHGEGRFSFPNQESMRRAESEGLVALRYALPDGSPTMKYPFNPNGSPGGIAGLCSPDGRHLAMMPHPERLFRKEIWPWMPPEWENLEASPWLTMFINARKWCTSTV